MKTIRMILIACMAIMMLPMRVDAQHYVYHNIGDTIHGRDTIYHYQWWSDEWFNSTPNNNHRLYLQYYCTWPEPTNSSRTEIVRYCYTATPVNVIGIAGAVFPCMAGTGYWNRCDSTRLPEYFRLYDACVDSFPLKASARYRASDPHRYMSIVERSTNVIPSCCDVWRVDSVVIPIYEYYFEDKPIQVTDSFYVGITGNSNGITTEGGFFDPRGWLTYYTIGYVYTPSESGQLNCQNCVSSPVQQYKYRDNSLSGTNHDWRWASMSRFMLVFPILEIDTNFAYPPPDTTPYVCPEIENARLNAVVDDIAIVMWNSNSEYLHAEVSYGPSGIQPGEGTVLTTLNSNPFLQLPGIDSCTHYVAYVRAMCDHEDSIYYSEWSDSISIYNCNTGTGGGGDEPDPEGIDEVGAMAQFTYLIPNPATDQLQIACGFQMKQVELYDAQGRRVMQQAVDGVTTMVNLEGLDAGTYIVLIRTQQGQLITKRLVKR